MRQRLAHAVRRAVGALRPAEHGRPAGRALLPGPGGALPAGDTPDPRARAREALEEARASMPSLLDERAPVPAPPALEHVPPESALLRQALRAYTDHIEHLLEGAEEERRALRHQVNRLTEELLVLRAEMTELRAALPTPDTTAARLPAASGGEWGAAPVAGQAASVPAGQQSASEGADADAPLEAVLANPVTANHEGEAAPLVREGEDPALTAQLFPAGTIGVLLELRPGQRPHHVASICARLAAEVEIDHVAPAPDGDGETRLRVSFRRPVRWPWLRDAVERAAGAVVDPASAAVENGMVRLRLRVPRP